MQIKPGKAQIYNNNTVSPWDNYDDKNGMKIFPLIDACSFETT